ncbi:AbrB/MazE/SpoVT family DNA-binding domain-containing protein [Candidatus Woesearchaeota archaeon]|nr:AbrB/MazE/SpoVT family DNA-binding domain-containing protein [Candidatus Woesearchaeota archaeon]
MVIPRDLREELGIEPGDSLQIERVDDMIVLKKVQLDSLEKKLKEVKR